MAKTLLISKRLVRSDVGLVVNAAGAELAPFTLRTNTVNAPVIYGGIENGGDVGASVVGATVAIEGSALTTTIAAGAAIKSAFHTVYWFAQYGGVNTGTADQGVAVVWATRSDNNPHFGFLIKSIASTVGPRIGQINVMNKSYGYISAGQGTIPLGVPLSMRMRLEQLNTTSWTFNGWLDYRLDDKGPWINCGVFTGLDNAGGAIPASISFGPVPPGGGGALFKSRFAGAYVYRDDLLSDTLLDAPDVGTGWVDFRGFPIFMDVELASGGVGDLASPLSPTQWNAHWVPHAEVATPSWNAWLRNGVELERTSCPPDADVLMAERNAGTLTLARLPELRILAKAGAKQRINANGSNMILRVRTPMHVTTDTPGVRPNLWHTVVITPGEWTVTGTPGVYQANCTFASPYLFQDGAPLATTNNASGAAAIAYCNGGAGRFGWFGNVIYMRAFGDVNPTVAPSGTFDRSQATSTDATGFVMEAEGRIADLSVSGTLIKPGNSSVTIGGYGFGTVLNEGVVEFANLIADLNDKHSYGQTPNSIGQVRVLWRNLWAGRCAVYGGAGSQTVLVDYNGLGAATALNAGSQIQSAYDSVRELFPGFNGYTTDGNPSGGVTSPSNSYYTSHLNATKNTVVVVSNAAGLTYMTLANTVSGSGPSFVRAWSGGSSTSPAWAGIEFASNPVDTAFVTLTGPGGAVTFEFDNNASVTGGRTLVTIGASLAATMANLKTAIDASILGATATVTVDTSIPKVVFTNCDVRSTGFDSQHNGQFTFLSSVIRRASSNGPTLIERCTLGEFPASASQTINDCYIFVTDTNPTSALNQWRINGGRTVVGKRNTFDLSQVTWSSASSVFTYFGTGTYKLDVEDSIFIMPNQAAISFATGTFANTGNAIWLAGRRNRWLVPFGVSLGSGHGFTTALAFSSITTYEPTSDANASYSFYGIGPDRRLTRGSILLGTATPEVNGRDRTGVRFPLRNDAGAFEFFDSSLGEISRPDFRALSRALFRTAG